MTTRARCYRDGMTPGASVNAALQQALSQVGWSSYELARRINKALGGGYVHRTTPRAWCISGVTPRDPLPATVARLLSEEVGRIIRPGDLWPGIHADGPVAAHEGLIDGWTPENLGRLRVDLDIDAEGLVCISGTKLLQVTRGWAVVAAPSESASIAGEGDDPVLTHLRGELARLRTIDEGMGGQALLTVVAHQQRLLATLAVQYGETSWQARACLALLAQYTQFAGWLALDLGEHPRAQRSFFLALRLCRLADDTALASLVLSCLAVQSLGRGRPQDARRLSELATRDDAQPSMIMWMRRARSSAACGDSIDFQASMDKARNYLHSSAERPAWSYWITDELLDAEEGRGWADLRAPARARPLLTRLITNPRAGGRDRVLYGAALTEANLRDGAVDQACAELEDTLVHLPATSSHRCRNLLNSVVGEIATGSLSSHHRQIVDAARVALAAEPAIKSA